MCDTVFLLKSNMIFLDIPLILLNVKVILSKNKDNNVLYSMCLQNKEIPGTTRDRSLNAILHVRKTNHCPSQCVQI